MENHKKYCKNTKNNVIYYKSNSKGLYYELFRFNEILGVYKSIQEAINILSNQYELGEYIVQECNGDESGYTNYISSWQLISV